MARGHYQTDLVHGAPPVVGEDEVLETQFATHRRNKRCITARRRRCVEQVHDAVHRGHRALVQVGHVGEPRHRPQQSLRQIDECGIASDAELSVQGQPAAVQERGNETGEHGHADHRRDRGGDANRRGVTLAELVRSRAHVFGFETFRRVGLDRRHAGKIVVQARGHRRRGLARGGIARIQPLLEPERAEQDQGHRQQGQHGEAAGQGEEHRADEQGGTEHLDQVVRTGIEETLDLVDILVQQRHQPATALARDGVGR